MIIVLIGPKGSGKSFIGRLLHGRLGIHFLDVEPIWIEYYAECQKRRVQPSIVSALNRVKEAIENTLCESEHVLFETTAAAPELQEFIDRLCREHDTKKIKINTPLEVCLSRIKTRNQQNQIPMDEENIRKIFEITHNLQLDYHLSLDNNNLPENQIIKKIESLLLNDSR